MNDLPDEDDDDVALDPGFADRFEQHDRRLPCQLYLISPPAVDAKVRILPEGQSTDVFALMGVEV